MPEAEAMNPKPDALTRELLDTHPAKLWRAYVLNRDAWTEEKWEAAQARGLAIRRVIGRPVLDVAHRTENDRLDHFWTLTDNGLDLFAEGAVR